MDKRNKKSSYQDKDRDYEDFRPNKRKELKFIPPKFDKRKIMADEDDDDNDTWDRHY